MSNVPASGSGAAKPEPALGLADQFRVMGRIFPLLWPKGEPELRLRTATTAALVIFTKLVNVAMPIFYKLVVDALTGATNAAIVVPVALIFGYGLLRLATQSIGDIRDLVFIKVHERALRLVSLNVFTHLHTLSLRFHLERQTGGLSRAIERGTAAIEFMLTYLLLHLMPTVVELALVGIVLWHYFSFTLAASTLAIIIGYGAYTAYGTQWRMKFRRDMNAADTEASSRVVDSLLNFETVKYFANEAHEIERFDAAKKKYVTAAIANQRALTTFNGGQGVILALGIIIVMLLAAYGVVQGRSTIGDFVMVNAYLLQLYGPLNMLGWVYRNLRQSMIDIGQMYGLLAEHSDIVDKPDAAPLKPGPGRVVFDHVSFAYDTRRPILRDVSFEVAPGKKVAIVGPTGSGKTTVARLLFRFYDPQAGRIAIDGQDLRDVTQLSVRRAVGVVPQDTVLFNDTIQYNILFGRVDAPKEDVKDAATRAQLGDFIASLPDGYATRVGERGLKLSGGEKQRVAIARVVLKNPEILVFDEATSSLDSHTEAEILASLGEVSAHRSTLVIAHRLSTIVDADEILVLDDGRIVERGSHEALIARGGAYAAMWERQQAGEEDDLAAVAE